MPKLLNYLKNSFFSKSSFKANVFMLMICTILSQFIAFIATFFIARLYSPNDFGIFGFCMSFVSIISVVVMARYELAITLPEKDEEAFNIVGLCVIISIFISFITLLLVCLLKLPFVSRIYNIKVSNFFYFVPLLVFVSGILRVLILWSIRKQHFRKISFNKIYSTLASSSMKVMMGCSAFGAIGLFFGEVFGSIIGIMNLASRAWGEFNNGRISIKKAYIKQMLVRYRDFPRYSILSDLINVVSNQLPLICFSLFFGMRVAGFYAFTQKTLGIPLTLISGSVLDVFRQRASDDFIKLGNCRDIFVKTFKHLFWVSLFPFLLLFLFGQQIFAFLFSHVWRESGVYAQILSVFLLTQFFSPLTYVFIIAEKQRFNLIFQICLLGVSLLSLLIGIYLKSVKISLIYFSALYSGVFIIYLFFSYKLSKNEKILRSA